MIFILVVLLFSIEPANVSMTHVPETQGGSNDFRNSSGLGSDGIRELNIIESNGIRSNLIVYI